MAVARRLQTIGTVSSLRLVSSDLMLPLNLNRIMTGRLD
jgi:hypothetical protein